MKDKKKVPSKKIFAIGGLSLLCIAVLIGAFILTREPEDDFVPAATESSATTNTWEEKSEPEQPVSSTQESSQKPGSAADQTQQITSEGESGTVSSLSDTKTKEDAVQNKPKETPKTNDDLTDPDKQPEYDSTVPQTGEASVVPKDDTTDTPPASSESTDDSHAGQVYDPVFGWIETGKTQQDSIDSDGDINKQIGTMGGN